MTYGMEPGETVLEAVTRFKGSETQTAFAARLGLTQGEVSRYLTGARGLTPRIAAALIRTYPKIERAVVHELLDIGGHVDDSDTARLGLAVA